MKRIACLAVAMSVYLFSNAQSLEPELFTIPPQYTIVKTEQAITIDGKDNETAWSKAPWTRQFNDIKTGKESASIAPTKAKMLWDDQYLYVYAVFPEKHIWASLKEHDSSVFHDHALEIFIDPDGSGQNYMEFQINALEAVWDLILTKPYRNGGKSISDWDIKGLKKAVHIEGTLNDPSDEDSYWSIELALPFKSLMMGQGRAPRSGTIWRMNLTRVQWQLDQEDGMYKRTQSDRGRPLPPEYLSWATQGIVNFHYPERWGYVRFAELNEEPSDFLNTSLEQIKLDLWYSYYLAQTFKDRHQRYANSIQELRNEYPELNELQFIDGIDIQGNKYQFWLQYIPNDSSDAMFSIDQEGKFTTWK